MKIAKRYSRWYSKWCPKGLVSQKLAPGRLVPERLVPERLVPERIASTRCPKRWLPWWAVGLIAATPAIFALVVLVLGLFEGLSQGSHSGFGQNSAIHNNASQNNPSQNKQGILEQFDEYTRHAIGFTIKQALLSTAISLICGLLCALRLLAIEKRKRQWLVDALILCFVLPPLVVAFGVIELFGYNGLFNSISLAITSTRIFERIYGLSGIIVAHVFFNVPLVAYIFLQRLEDIGQMPFRLARELRLSFLLVLRHVVFPCLRPVVAALSAVVFSLCLTSFTIILILGGGPRATTLSVAIFEAVRFDFNPQRAALLATIQILLSFIVLSLSAPKRLTRAPALAREQSMHSGLLIQLPKAFKMLATLMLLMVLFVPSFALVSGIVAGADIATERIFYQATFVTIALGGASAICCSMLALPLLWSVREGSLMQNQKGYLKFLPEVMLALGAYPLLAVPPIVLALGVFLLMQGSAIYQVAPIVSLFVALVVINALLALPIVLRFFSEPFYAIARDYSHLWKQLDISYLARFINIDLPTIKKSLKAAIACAFCLSIADLSAIALFGRNELMTIPYLAYILMGRYKWQQAGFCIAVLIGIYLVVFRLMQKK